MRDCIYIGRHMSVVQAKYNKPKTNWALYYNMMS